MSLPCHQPEKWNGMKAWSGPTPSVILAVTLILAAALVLDQAPARENDREVLADVLVLLLDRLEQRRQAPEHLDIVVGRILVDEVRADAVERLAVLRDAVGEVPH